MSHKKWYLIASAVVAVTIFTAAVVLVRKISGGDATFARVAAVSDYSIRSGLRVTDDEYALRHFIATELLRRARDRFRPPQEAEIDEERRPDIRIEHPAVAGPISIEIKWAENWTVVQLLERLETQLVGTYMRPYDSHFGVFLLGMIARSGKSRWQNPAGGHSLSFQQVVATVRARASELLASVPGVHGIAVVDIDFRPPSHWAD